MSDALAIVQVHLLTSLAVWQQAAPRAGIASRTRQLITATIGLIVIVALPAILIYYARRRWRP